MYLSLLISCRDVKDYNNNDWVEFLKVAESLGGSVALQKSIGSSPQGPPKKSPPDLFPPTGARLQFTPFPPIFTIIYVSTFDNHIGNGMGLGNHFPDHPVDGTLYRYNSWGAMEVKPDQVEIHGGQDAIIRGFWLNQGSVVAYFEGKCDALTEVSGFEFKWVGT